MYYNGKHGKHVETFLNEVHAAINAKYNSARNNDAINAMKLQKFFQELKTAAAAKRKDSEVIYNMFLDDLLNDIDAIAKTRNKNYKITNLFKRRGKNSQEQGMALEQELTDVIEAVLEEISGEKVLREDINIGAKTGNVKFTAIDDMIQNVNGNVKDEVITKLNKEKQPLYYLKNVAGKIDVKGFEVSITGQPKKELLDIYNLLKDATFSAKNYDSMSKEDKIQSAVEGSRRGGLIHLGSSNPYRAIYGSLSSLGYENRTIDSAYYAGKNRIELYNSDNASQHFFHLRYIYELTGAGILYSGGVNFGEARYLIYNDPSGNIYVKSTSEIIADLLNDNNPPFSGSPFQSISISKTAFY